MLRSAVIAAFLLMQSAAQPAPTSRLSGRVIANDVSQAASTAKFRLPIQVQLSPVNPGNGRSQTVAVGADGSFAFPAVRPGQYSLSAPEFSFPPERVNVTDADIVNFQFKVPLIRAVGRVVDPENRPVPGARVSFIRDKEYSSHETCKGAFYSPECYEALAKDGAISAEGYSKSDGRFEIQVPGGLTNDSYIRAEGMDERGTRMIQGWPISPNRKLYPPDMGEIKLDRWRELRVLIQADGKPITGAQVDFGGQPVVSDKNGEVRYGLYFYAGLVGVQFSVRANGYAVEGRSLGLPSEGSRMTVNLSREIPLEGRVVDTAGAAVTDSIVTLGSPDISFVSTYRGGGPKAEVDTVRTDSDGRFTVHGLKSGGKYQLGISPRAGLPLVPATLELIGGAAPFEVRLERAGEVVVNAEYPPSAERSYDRAALEMSRDAVTFGADPPIGLEHQDPNGAWRPIDVRLRVEQAQPGSFQVRFTQVPAGATRVIVESRGGVASDASDAFQVVTGAPASVAVRMVMTRTLRVAVVDDRDMPVAGARVEWPLPQANGSEYMQTNATGWVDINVNPSRALNIKVSAPRHSDVNQTVPASASSPITIVLPSRQ